MSTANGPKQKREMAQSQRRVKVADLYVRGYSQQAIAMIVGVCRETICKDIHAMQQEWMVQRVHSLDVRKARELQKLDEVERQCWLEWDLSKRVAETTTEAPTGRTIKRECRGGDTRYLKIILECVVQRCELLGLYPDQWGQIDWSKLSDDQVRRIAEGEDPRSVLAESSKGAPGTPPPATVPPKPTDPTVH